MKTYQELEQAIDGAASQADITTIGKRIDAVIEGGGLTDAQAWALTRKAIERDEVLERSAWLVDSYLAATSRRERMN